jgi:hypothetical protein
MLVNGSSHVLHVSQFSHDKLSKWIEFMKTRKGGNLVRLFKKQKTDNPSVQGVWNPFTNKHPIGSIEKYPSVKYEQPLNSRLTATQKILELQQNNKF